MTGFEWVFSPANLEALDPVHGLLAEDTVAGWGRDAIASALRLASSRGLLAREPSGRVLGVVLARRIADLVEIDQVAVRAEARRRGVASALLQRLLTTAADEGCREARLELAVGNAPARALYAGLGFVVVGQRERYYPDGEDALLLTRVLSPT